MSRSTILRSSTRIATATATAALAGLLVVAPASARPDPGTGGPDFTQSERSGSGTTRVVPQPAAITVDDGTVEYLQVGAGLLAGVALAGAGAALVSRRQHRTAHPA